MNRLIRLGALMVPLFCIASRVEAQGTNWSVISGRTVGTDNNILHLQAGWPGISATFLHGSAPNFDFGGAFTFNYGFEGAVSPGAVAGIKLQGVLRFKLADTPKYNLGIRFDPGFLFYFPSGATIAGMTVPFYFAAGFPVNPQVMLVAGFDLPISIFFTQGGWVAIPILFGGGVEYELQRDLLLTFNLRMGPGIVAGSGYTGTGFVLTALMGVALKL